jgi:hypothetical protein
MKGDVFEHHNSKYGKSGLIIHTPLYQVSDTDLSNIIGMDADYLTIISNVKSGAYETDYGLDKYSSWFEVRSKLRPYTFEYTDGSEDTIISNLKYEALKKISHKRKEIRKCCVEILPGLIRTLEVPREAKGEKNDN